MEVKAAYCATHDRPVRVVIEDDQSPDGIVCLEHGDTCTGAMCPIFDVPSEEMKERLEAYRREAEGEGTP